MAQVYHVFEQRQQHQLEQLQVRNEHSTNVDVDHVEGYRIMKCTSTSTGTTATEEEDFERSLTPQGIHIPISTKRCLTRRWNMLA